MSSQDLTTDEWLEFYERGKVSRSMVLWGGDPETLELLMRLGYNRITVADEREDKALGLPTVSWEDAAESVRNSKETHFFVCGITRSGTTRMKCIRRIEALVGGATNWTWTNVISPRATLLTPSMLGRGVLVHDNSYVGTEVRLDDHVVIKPMAAVFHNSHIGAGSVVFGGALVQGRCTLGRQCSIYPNAVVLAEGSLMDGTTIGTLMSVKRIDQGEVVE